MFLFEDEECGVMATHHSVLLLSLPEEQKKGSISTILSNVKATQSAMVYVFASALLHLSNQSFWKDGRDEVKPEEVKHVLRLYTACQAKREKDAEYYKRFIEMIVSVFLRYRESGDVIWSTRLSSGKKKTRQRGN